MNYIAEILVYSGDLDGYLVRVVKDSEWKGDAYAIVKTFIEGERSYAYVPEKNFSKFLALLKISP